MPSSAYLQTITEGLSELEREYLRQLIGGVSAEALTTRLRLTTAQSARIHRSLKAKLDARNTADLVGKGLMAGL